MTTTISKRVFDKEKKEIDLVLSFPQKSQNDLPIYEEIQQILKNELNKYLHV